MPTYEYFCEQCASNFETVQRFSDAPLTTCPHGHQTGVRRLIRPAGIIFKGSGWYIKDSKADGATSGNGKGSAKSASSRAGESASEGQSEKAATASSEPKGDAPAAGSSESPSSSKSESKGGGSSEAA